MKTITLSDEDLAALHAVRLRCGGSERSALDRIVAAAEQVAPHGEPVPLDASGQGPQMQRITWMATPGNEILSFSDGILSVGIHRGGKPVVMFPANPPAGHRRAIAGIDICLSFTDYAEPAKAERSNASRSLCGARVANPQDQWHKRSHEMVCELEPHPEGDHKCGGIGWPFAVGDYVRWDPNDGLLWVEGELIGIGDLTARIRAVRNQAGAQVDGVVGSFALNNGATLRRVPRPDVGEQLARAGTVSPEVIEEFRVPPTASAHPPCAFCDAALTTFTAYEHGQSKVCEACYAGIGKAGAGVFRDMVTWQIETYYDAARDPGGHPLAYLLRCDELNAQHDETSTFSSAERAAISAYRSAQLRERVAASTAISKAREVSVVCDSGEADE